MQSSAQTVQEYIERCPLDQKQALIQIRDTINEHIPEWFEECINYSMLGRVVPHSLYPNWYHCDPSLPLPFLNLAYQKKSISLYHMWLYSSPDLLAWFKDQYAIQSNKKLDMGKSCVRFKDYNEIPYGLIGELVSKISVAQRISLYESQIKK